MNKLKENERYDELNRKGYRIIQNPDTFCFGMDAVLLGGFAVAKENENVIDCSPEESRLFIIDHLTELFPGERE